MCFRPAEIQMKKCPKCGATARPIDKECQKCGEPLEDQKIDFDADQAKLDSAIKTPAPSAPAAPGAPKPPAVPGAPKPPIS